MTTTISRRRNVPGPSIDPRTEPYVIRRVQVHQHNDSGLLEFFNTHGVEYDRVQVLWRGLCGRGDGAEGVA